MEPEAKEVSQDPSKPVYQELLEYILRKLVKYPSDISVSHTEDEMGTLMIVKVNPYDRGIVIGKAGSMAISLRTLVGAVGSRNAKRVSLKIDAPDRR